MVVITWVKFLTLTSPCCASTGLSTEKIDEFTELVERKEQVKYLSLFG